MSQNKKSRDTIAQTLLVATVLCVVCSVLVASAAVGLRGRQEANKRLDKKKNVLIAAELFNKKEQADSEIDGIFETSIERVLIDLETGEIADPSVVDPETYDPRAASRNSELSLPIEPASKLGGIKRREKYAFVYRVKGPSGETAEQITKVVLPIYGKGLWSTLYGFIAISVDGTTIEGITFYQHGETPGLGAEIENPNWQGLWKGKQLLDKDKEIAITVIKGAVNANSAAAAHQVDGLSGATITCSGVTQLVRYWMGPEGFGPYLEKLRQTGGSDG
ncbi:MAG: Na(+)-translocating NADH-quinone reductase subunit C [Planctomycetes bacterium]|nr:Na(+)-translocating NADH-quinone reductase subunit C [Planctomycetota bacterium]